MISGSVTAPRQVNPRTNETFEENPSEIVGVYKYVQCYTKMYTTVSFASLFLLSVVNIINIVTQGYQVHIPIPGPGM